MGPGLTDSFLLSDFSICRTKIQSMPGSHHKCLADNYTVLGPIFFFFFLRCVLLIRRLTTTARPWRWRPHFRSVPGCTAQSSHHGLPGPQLSHFCVLVDVDEASAFPSLGFLACKVISIITHSIVARLLETRTTASLITHPALSTYWPSHMRHGEAPGRFWRATWMNTWEDDSEEGTEFNIYPDAGGIGGEGDPSCREKMMTRKRKREGDCFEKDVCAVITGAFRKLFFNMFSQNPQEIS